MFKIKQLLALMLSLFISLSYANSTKEISQEALQSLIDKKVSDVIVLDVRSVEEFNEGHIQGAVNMSYDIINENLIQLRQYKDSKVVVYCRSGRRAAIAERILAANGFHDLHHLTGDMNAWVEAELPVYNSKGLIK